MTSSFPARSPQVSPAVWQAGDVEPGDTWRVGLTEAQRDELVAAARAARDAGVATAAIDRDRFALPGMDAAIAEWSAMLERGRGFVLVRGFPIDLVDEAGTELAYVGLAARP